MKKLAFFIELEKKENFNEGKNDIVTEEYLELVKLFLSQKDLYQYLYEHQNGVALGILEFEKMSNYDPKSNLLIRVG